MNEKNELPRIQLSGPGFSMDRVVPEEIAQQVLLLVLTGTSETSKTAQQAVMPAQPLPSSSHTAAVIEKTLVEVFTESKATRNADKITCIAKYYKEQLKKPYVSRSEIMNGFEIAGEVPPANFARDLKWTVQQGWIAAKPSDKSLFFLTNSGATVVNAGFPDTLKPQAGSKRRKSENGQEGA